MWGIIDILQADKIIKLTKFITVGSQRATLRPGVRSPIVYFADPRSHIWLFVLIAGPGLLIITPPLLSTEFNWIVKMYSSLLGVPVHWLYGKHLPLWALGVRLSDCQDIFYVLDYWVLSKSKQNIGKILSRQNIWIIFTGEKPFCYNLFFSRGRWTCTEENVSNFYSIIFLFQNRIQMYTLKLHWI